MLVTAVIPAFNEGPRIASTVLAVQPFVNEVVVIDDGSQDHTVQEAVNVGARVVKQGINQGYISAIKRGFQEASGEIVVTIDADGEFPAAKIPAIIEPILEGRADMVQGRRGTVPRPSERLLTYLASLKGPVGDSGTGFRALTTTFARRLQLSGVCICAVFSLEVLFKGGRIVEVPVKLEQTDKPRRIAWYHIRQFFYLVPWMFRRLDRGGSAS